MKCICNYGKRGEKIFVLDIYLLIIKEKVAGALGGVANGTVRGAIGVVEFKEDNAKRQIMLNKYESC